MRWLDLQIPGVCEPVKLSLDMGLKEILNLASASFTRCVCKLHFDSGLVSSFVPFLPVLSVTVCERLGLRWANGKSMQPCGTCVKNCGWSRARRVDINGWKTYSGEKLCIFFKKSADCVFCCENVFPQFSIDVRCFVSTKKIEPDKTKHLIFQHFSLLPEGQGACWCSVFRLTIASHSS